MTIHLFTGFEGCDDIAEAMARLNNAYEHYNQYSSIAFFTGGTYGNHIRLTANAAVTQYVYILGVPVPTALVGKTVAAGAYIYSSTWVVSTSYGHAGHIFRFFGPDIWVASGTSGIVVYRDTTLIASDTSGLGAISRNEWHHVEFQIYSHASAGTVIVKVDGITRVNASGLNTGGADITVVGLNNAGAGSRYYDNVYIADQLHGRLQALLKRPNADYDCDWIASAGSSADNYSEVDEVGNDDDTTYVESATLNDTDLYDFEDVTEDITIHAVELVTVAKTVDAGARSLTHKAQQESSLYDQTEFAVTSAYLPHLRETLNTAPDGSAWSIEKFNGCKFGFEITV